MWTRERARRTLLLGLRRRSHGASTGAARAQGRDRPLRRPRRLHGAAPSSSTPRTCAPCFAPYHARVRAELERFGGTVEKFIGDAVMALFGAPSRTRTIPSGQCARRSRSATGPRDEERLQVRIAVNTGEALVTLDARAGSGRGDGRRRRREHGGPAPVGRAGQRRSWSASRPTARPSGRSSTASAEPVEAKGRRSRSGLGGARRPARARRRRLAGEPRAARRPGARAASCSSATLGRVRAEREPQLVTLVGVPGIGKCRLVYELFETVDAEPRAHLLAPGPLAPLRRGRQLLGARRDGQGAGRDPRDRLVCEAQAKLADDGAVTCASEDAGVGRARPAAARRARR